LAYKGSIQLLPAVTIIPASPTAATATAATAATAATESAAAVSAAAESAAATATVTTPAATATKSAGSTAFGFVCLGFGLIDDDLTVLQHLAVQRFNSLFTLTARAHLDKSEPFGSAGDPVRDDLGAGDLTISFEHFRQFIFGDAESKITHIKFHAAFPPWKSIVIKKVIKNKTRTLR
jgi:hypothetical protein